MGHAKGADLWYRSGVMCAYNCEVLIGYWSTSVQDWCMMPLQLSEKGFCCWELQSSRAAQRETVLAHRTAVCSLRILLNFPFFDPNIYLDLVS